MEALAAASSVLAVISVAVQLTSSIQKLISFWDSIIDAPAEILEIKTHLLVFCEVLRAIETDSIQCKAENASDVSLANDCLGICVTSIEKLEMLTRELDVGLQKRGVKRKWMCLKKVVREKKVLSYWAEVERAKSMLLLYQRLRNGRQRDSTLRLLSESAGPSHASSSYEMSISVASHGVQAGTGRPNTAFRARTHSMESHSYELGLSFGTLTIRIASSRPLVISPGGRSNVSKRQKQHRITVILFPSMMRTVLEWTFSYQHSSWKTGLQAWNLRPSAFSIFELCFKGDVQNVRKLFDDGDASPYDVDPEGWSPIHFAAAGHHAQLCHMLIDLGAQTNCLTRRLRSPLHLATQSSSRHYPYRIQTRTSCIDSLRVLVESGNNDPMLFDRLGFTPIFEAAMNPDIQSLSWLMSQTYQDIEMRCASSGGVTMAAFIAQRPDLSLGLLNTVLRHGIEINLSCARTWRFRRYGLPIEGNSSQFYYSSNFNPPSLDVTMLQLAVWNLYDKFFDYHDPFYRNQHNLPLSWESWDRGTGAINASFDTVKSLLESGADFYCQTGSGHTILDGLMLDLIQFNGDAKPLHTYSACIESWLQTVQKLGFDLKDYIRHESAHKFGKSHDLGLGLVMMFLFDEECYPHIWTAFQGPHEREKNQVVNHISQCRIWPEWQRMFALPEPPVRPKPWKYKEGPLELVTLHEHDDEEEDNSTSRDHENKESLKTSTACLSVMVLP
ncbi:hypothetical protein IFR05_001879 [Cadophora sp. M221]|nr:hypothetical protein IFR05_001879 [Cadophora sp. M221]